MMKRQGMMLCTGLLAMLLIGCTGGGSAARTRASPASAPASASGALGSTAMAPGGGSSDGGGAAGAGQRGQPRRCRRGAGTAEGCIHGDCYGASAFWLAVEGGYLQQQGLEVN